MEIVYVNDRCFHVLAHINAEKFTSQEKVDEYFKNKVYLRKPNSSEVLIVHEIFDGLIPDSAPINTYEQAAQPETHSIDTKI